MAESTGRNRKKAGAEANTITVQAFRPIALRSVVLDTSAGRFEVERDISPVMAVRIARYFDAWEASYLGTNPITISDDEFWQLVADCLHVEVDAVRYPKLSHSEASSILSFFSGRALRIPTTTAEPPTPTPSSTPA